MPTIKGFSTTNPEKVKEALGYCKLPLPKKFLKKVVINGIEYDPECVGVKLEEEEKEDGRA